ncbi:MAG: metallophosphoesterase [Nitrospirota bacterium]|nr:metallophosphoesterase [Nitrospirota bacterium]
MLIFAFLVITYSTANYYLYSKLTLIFSLSAPFDALLGGVILFMTISPVLIPISSHRASERALKLFSLAGYMWIALLVPYFTAGVVLDLYNLAARSLASEHGLRELSSYTTFIVPMLLSLAINIYGLLEARSLCIERLVIKTVKLPEGVDRIRIAQISDLHLSVLVREGLLERVIGIIEKENPDIIVSTGDLVDGPFRYISHLAGMLAKLRPRLGKYAVTGNHEIYAGISGSAGFIKEAGFTLLRGEAVTAGNAVNIAGMDFRAGETSAYNRDIPLKKEDEVLAALPDGLFTVLLKHRSDVEKESLGMFDLQLSGHTHKGQIFPMGLATMFIFPYHTGYTELAKGSAIYTSRGTGTTGPPVRFLSRPEVTIVDIVGETLI